MYYPPLKEVHNLRLFLSAPLQHVYVLLDTIYARRFVPPKNKSAYKSNTIAVMAVNDVYQFKI